MINAIPPTSSLRPLLQACQDKQNSQAFSAEKVELQQAYQSKSTSDLEFARRSCVLDISQLSCEQLDCAIQNCDMKGILFYAVRQRPAKAQCIHINDPGAIPATVLYDQSVLKITNIFFTLPNGKLYCDTVSV